MAIPAQKTANAANTMRRRMWIPLVSMAAVAFPKWLIGGRPLLEKYTTKTLRIQKTPGFPGVFIGGDGGI